MDNYHVVPINNGTEDPNSTMNMHQNIEEEMNELRGNARETEND